MLKSVSSSPSAVSGQSNASTEYLDIPTGTTAQRPATPNSGMLRFNTDSTSFEGHNGTAWGALGVGGGAAGVSSLNGLTGDLTGFATQAGVENLTNKNLTSATNTFPTLNQNTTGTAAGLSATLAVASGGTGATTAAAALTSLGAYSASNPSGYTSNTGTVTSVAAGTGLSGGTITTTGTIGLASGYGDTQNPYDSKTANHVLAAPNGSAGAPTFRAIAAADIPTLNQDTTGSSGSCTGNAATATTASNVSGTVAVANGGTGSTTASGARTALSAQETLVSATNIKTINGNTLLGAGDLVVSGGGGSSTITIDNKTAAYTVVAGDIGKVINCTANTFTVSLTAAATLGSGFNCWIWNTSSTATDAITLDPANAETIDGKTTLILRRGEGMQIVCDGTNWQTVAKKTMRGYAENISNTSTRPVASGTDSVALGHSATASGEASFAGPLCMATATNSVALGVNTGWNGSQVVTGVGAMALGGSYASGSASFAAAVNNNTSSYGATAANSIAIGQNAKASGSSGISIGSNSYAANTVGCAIGSGAQALQYGKFAYEGYSGHGYGYSQIGMLICTKNTTDATATILTSNNGTASSENQLILPNNSAYAFDGIIVARQRAVNGTQSAAWKVEGLIRREATAATTTLVASTVTAISNTPGWTLALSADTTNGGLAVTFTGAAATNIRTVATLRSSEVTYA